MLTAAPGRCWHVHQAVLEETDVRIAELKKEAYEFKRDIVVGAENFRTGKTMAEKVIRYMEEKLRQKVHCARQALPLTLLLTGIAVAGVAVPQDAMIEKLRLKNATLKTHIKKVEVQLKHKEEMGDVLHYIDFHQLQIENKQYVAKIDERNQELLQLKMTTGKTVQVLNDLKVRPVSAMAGPWICHAVCGAALTTSRLRLPAQKKLNALIHESEWLKQEIQQRTELLAKVRTTRMPCLG